MGQDINQEALNQDLIRGINLLNHDIRDAHSLKLVCDALNNGADIDTPNHNGITLLMMACQKGADSLVEWILENHHPNVNLSNAFGVTALYQACGLCNLSTVKRLVEKGADINQDIQSSSALFYAIEMRQTPKVANCLIELGADIFKVRAAGDSLLFPIIDGVLTQATEEFDNESLFGNDSFLVLAKSLIEKGLDINHQDNGGNTLLMKAVKRDVFNIVEFLVEHGADLSLCNNEGHDVISISKNYIATHTPGYLRKTIIKKELEASDIRESSIDSAFKLQR